MRSTARVHVRLLGVLGAALLAGTAATTAWAGQPIKAIYIPLADHYAGIVAYEKYRAEMKAADYTIEQMKSWDLLRAYFRTGEVDLAFIICPMAMDMFAEDPDFRWVSLIHRDGNALAINDLLNAHVRLPSERLHRKPDARVAEAFTLAKKEMGRPTECGVPHLLATHTVVLYKYLRDHGKTLGLGSGRDRDVIAVMVPPPRSPAFIKKNNSRGIPASFEQSLPWADVVETQNFGHVAWYSKDVIPWPQGHVECIIIATDECVVNKRAALQEVIDYIHKAGLDIERARAAGGPAMLAISDMIRKHIPDHNEAAIIQSLRPDLNAIRYDHLNVDPAGLNQIMRLALEGGILQRAIDIAAFTDSSFATEITQQSLVTGGFDYSGYPDEITDTTKRILTEQIGLLQAYAGDPIIVNAVEEQNATGTTLDEIKAIDREWTAGHRQGLVSSLMSNAAATFLRGILESNEQIYTEAFLCDRQGAVVGEYPRTTDYWQGDERKFTACFNKGSGKVFVGPLDFDESTRSVSVKVSVPVKDNAETIGVLIVGIRNIE